MWLDFLEFWWNENNNTTDQIKQSCGVSWDVGKEFNIKVNEVLISKDINNLQNNNTSRPPRKKDMRDSL